MSHGTWDLRVPWVFLHSYYLIYSLSFMLLYEMQGKHKYFLLLTKTSSLLYSQLHPVHCLFKQGGR